MLLATLASTASDLEIKAFAKVHHTCQPQFPNTLLQHPWGQQLKQLRRPPAAPSLRRTHLTCMLVKLQNDLHACNPTPWEKKPLLFALENI